MVHPLFTPAPESYRPAGNRVSEIAPCRAQLRADDVRRSCWLKTTTICGAFWSRRCKMPDFDVIFLRQRPVGLSAAARGTVRTAADRYRDAGNGRNRAGAPARRTRPRHQDHVHHRLCGGGAQLRSASARKMPRSSRSRSTCASWSTRSTRCWRPDKPRFSAKTRTDPNRVLASPVWSRYRRNPNPRVFGRVAQRESTTLTW